MARQATIAGLVAPLTADAASSQLDLTALRALFRRA